MISASVAMRKSARPGSLRALISFSVVVAAQHQQPDGRLGAFVFGGEDDRLDRALERNVQQLGHGFALRLARRGVFFISSAGAARLRVERQRFGRFDVRRVVARSGNRRSRLRPVSAITWNSCEPLPPIDAGVRLDRAEVQTAAREDAHVRVVHLAIRSSRRPSASLSNEYASFMMNSRPRIRPKRGRISSRNFVWIW